MYNCNILFVYYFTNIVDFLLIYFLIPFPIHNADKNIFNSITNYNEEQFMKIFMLNNVYVMYGFL